MTRSLARMKLILVLLLIFLPGWVWVCGGWKHPVRGCIEFDADRETFLLQISLKIGKDYSHCLHVYNTYCNGIVNECLQEQGWETVKR